MYTVSDRWFTLSSLSISNYGSYVSVSDLRVLVPHFVTMYVFYVCTFVMFLVFCAKTKMCTKTLAKVNEINRQTWSRRINRREASTAVSWGVCSQPVLGAYWLLLLLLLLRLLAPCNHAALCLYRRLPIASVSCKTARLIEAIRWRRGSWLGQVA